MTGFIAATLVHTEAGLVRIDRISVGDRVLAARAGTAAAPRPVAVTRLVGPLQAPIRHIGSTPMQNPPSGTRFNRLFAACDQPVWVVGTGWTAASRLLGDWLGPSPMGSLGGAPQYAVPDFVYQCGTPGLGWVGAASLERQGLIWDFQAERFVRAEPFDTHTWPQDPETDSGIPCLVPVYSFGLDDADSFFVTEPGIQVRAAQAS